MGSGHLGGGSVKPFFSLMLHIHHSSSRSHRSPNYLHRNVLSMDTDSSRSLFLPFSPRSHLSSLRPFHHLHSFTMAPKQSFTGLAKPSKHTTIYSNAKVTKKKRSLRPSSKRSIKRRDGLLNTAIPVRSGLMQM